MAWVVGKPEGNSYGFECLVFERIIGKGSFSSVWLAWDLYDGKALAVKLQTADQLDRSVTAKFERDGSADVISLWDKAQEELEILKIVSQCSRVATLIHVFHCSIPRSQIVACEYAPFEVLVWDEDQEEYYVPARSVRGGDPKCRYRLNLAGWLYLAEELCVAMSEIHKAGVVHKDVKPENCRLSEPLPMSAVRVYAPCEIPEDSPVHDWTPLKINGFLPRTNEHDVMKEVLWDHSENTARYEDSPPKVKTPHVKADTRRQRGTLRLIDWNSACCAERNEIWDAMGTTAFSPPECFDQNQPVFDGEKRDMWSVGVFLWVAAAGSLPFSGSHPLKVQMKILSCKLDWGRLGGTIFDAEQRALELLKGLLARNFEQRVSSEEALRELEHLK